MLSTLTLDISECGTVRKKIVVCRGLGCRQSHARKSGLMLILKLWLEKNCRKILLGMLMLFVLLM